MLSSNIKTIQISKKCNNKVEDVIKNALIMVKWSLNVLRVVRRKNKLLSGAKQLI